MEDEKFSQNFGPLSSRLMLHLLPLSLGCMGLLLMGYGLITYLAPKSASNDISFETVKPEESSVKNLEEEIVVDVAGSVTKPGVYRLKAGSRVQDALLAAGGFTDDADKQQLQHSLNLAAKLTDGMKLYIPKIGEEISANSSAVSTAVAGVSSIGLISINSGSLSELDTLPGVGPVTAEKIIARRPYSSLEELVGKKAVNKGVFEKIKDKISL